MPNQASTRYEAIVSAVLVHYTIEGSTTEITSKISRPLKEFKISGLEVSRILQAHTKKSVKIPRFQ